MCCINPLVFAIVIVLSSLPLLPRGCLLPGVLVFVGLITGVVRVHLDCLRMMGSGVVRDDDELNWFDPKMHRLDDGFVLG